MLSQDEQNCIADEVAGAISHNMSDEDRKRAGELSLELMILDVMDEQGAKDPTIDHDGPFHMPESV